MSSNNKSAKSKSLQEPKEHKAYYEELGRALSRWARLESTLGRTFADACRTSNPTISNSVFWAAVSFEAKSNLCSSAVRAALAQHPGFLTEWASLAERMNRKSRTRNKLAHGSIVTMHWKKNGKIKSDTFLSPFYYSQVITRRASGQKNSDPRPPKRMSLKNIISAAAGFSHLEHDLWDFSNRMHEELERADRDSDSTLFNMRPGRIYLSHHQTQE